MSIAEEIYAEVQTLPDELDIEVFDFIHFIDCRHALRHKNEVALLSANRRRISGSAKGKLMVLQDTRQTRQPTSEVSAHPKSAGVDVFAPGG